MWCKKSVGVIVIVIVIVIVNMVKECVNIYRDISIICSIIDLRVCVCKIR